ncbi:GNAT family N-acetyltransferase [Butyrivibrio sp. CB08]|uniref:GNAT family N-acetyltransferase n=1 Tax=Butyrivibrio sp. CB08 TaxID=2364879 RepID=UPI000EA9ECA8|nr:GNAT family N-acetyltransferase [Butyrivibrio sp. CB08]RKM57883.1 GNAT family N-acetyltransferase [Butyrivibrio sp. CB08]
MPWQVAAAGIWVNNQNVSLSVLTQYANIVISLMPKYDRFRMVFSERWWTWQPFYWNGFRSTPYYTMCVKADSVEAVLPSISKKRRERINRGKRKYRIDTDNTSFKTYWDFLKSSYEDRGRHLDYGEEKFYRLFTALEEHNACQIRSVYDQDRLVAVNIMLVDEEKYYHQFGAQMKKTDSSATSYAVYDAICSAVNSGKVFDFEGSMIQGVCEFNSSFNPKWETQYLIESYSARYILIDSIRKIGNVIKESISPRYRKRSNI